MSETQKQMLNDFESSLCRRFEDLVLEIGVENAPAIRSGALRALRSVKEAVDLLWEYYEVPGNDGDGGDDDNGGSAPASLN